MARFLIGIDDTDNDTSPGTGQLARRLAAEAVRRGATHRGITRHQFLIDDRIPYSSHNSGVCVVIDWPSSGDDLDFAMDLIAEWSAAGSDPGVCIAAADAVPPEVIDWGWRATCEVLDMPEAARIAGAAGIRLRPLGGTGQGIIGALGSVGLRAGGNEGRFLDMPGLRELPERTRLDELARIGIHVEHCSADAAHRETVFGGAGIGAGLRTTHPRTPTTRSDAGVPASKADRSVCPTNYLTLGWIRPRLVGGRAVWPVRWSSEHDAWIPLDQKRSRPLE
jgi:hypothetical protein